LSVVVVHRPRDGSAPVASPRDGRRAFGDDLLDEDRAPRSLRRAIDRLVTAITEKRDDDRDRNRDGDRS
jgi:hypothetical protein